MRQCKVITFVKFRFGILRDMRMCTHILDCNYSTGGVESVWLHIITLFFLTIEHTVLKIKFSGRTPPGNPPAVVFSITALSAQRPPSSKSTFIPEETRIVRFEPVLGFHLRLPHLASLRSSSEESSYPP